MKAFTKLQLSSDENQKSRMGTQVQAQPSRGELLDTNLPTPLQFDEFIPIMCLLFQSPETITVARILQEDYVKVNIRRASAKSAKSVKNKLTLSQEEQPKVSVAMLPVDDESVHIKAYYNLHGQLLEVSIVGCLFDINRTIIQVIAMAVPYHKTLSKLTITKGGLTATTLVEIGKLLPLSFLTDICFDETNVPQRNYSVVLHNASRLKNLSLNRCRLDDETCKEIAASIDLRSPGGTLRTLELGSNRISDEGALAFANVLRRNRQLLHLNLSGNFITDNGAAAILNTLMEFPMRYDEILDMKRNRMEFNRKKIANYEEYLRDMMIARHRERMRSASRSKSMRSTTGSSKQKSPAPKKATTSNKKNQIADSSVTGGDATENTLKVDYSHPELEQKAREAVGEFHDPFDSDHIVLKDRYFYCVGNMFLCSLNLAYNNLEYSTVQKINTVLEYQSVVKRPPGTTGLLRMTFEGNYVPKYCEDYVQIEIFLQNAINNQLPKAMMQKKRAPGLRRSNGTLGSK